MPKNHPKRTRQIIKSFEAKALKKRPLSIKIADWLTSYFGSMTFLAINLLAFILWILINTGKIPGLPIFDPYPHVLLTTTVSLEAIVLAIVVLISQNRENQISTLREEIQLQVEFIAEREITKILQLLKKILIKNNIKIADPELEEMLREVDPSYIERKLEEQLTPKTKPLAKKMVGGLHSLGGSDTKKT